MQCLFSEAFLTISGLTVKVISELSKPGICLSCTFLANSTADGCAVKMENDKHTFVFNVTQNNNSEDKPVLLECFPVPEAGEYSASVHEIHYGVVQEHVSTQVNNITVSKGRVLHKLVSIATLYNITNYSKLLFYRALSDSFRY